MSYVYIPSFDDFYINILDVLKDNYFHTKKNLYQKLMNSLISQLLNIQRELQRLLNDLNNYVEKENFSIINEINLDDFYSYIDVSKENLSRLLKYLEENKNRDEYYSKLYDIVDDLYTLVLQIDDRICTLETYRDIDSFKEVA